MDKQQNKSILLDAGTNEVEFLLFQIGKQSYGVNVEKICQIILFDEEKVAALPGQAEGVLGLIDFRGQTVSVVHLKKFLKIPDHEIVSERQLLLVAEFNKRKTAFVVDRVDRIERCGWDQFEAITKSARVNGVSSVIGTITLKDQIVILLDVETIMGTIDPSMSIEFYQDSMSSETKIDRSNVNMVLCEDSPVIQKILLSTLEKAGFRKIKSFSTGKDGLEFLQNTPSGGVDIILSDIEMPQMDGLTLCKTTKNLPNYKNVPFIFFSSMISEQMAAKCKSVGGDAWFTKPEIHLLVDAIDSYLVSKK